MALGTCRFKTKFNTIRSREIVTPNSDDERKWCWQCRRWLEKSEFAVDNNRSSGLQSKCRACGTASMKRWRRENK